MLSCLLITVGTPRVAHASCSDPHGSFSPCPVTITATPGTSGQTTTLVFTNPSTVSVTYNFACIPTAPVTSCSVSPTSVTLSGHGERGIQVTYATSSTHGEGSIDVYEEASVSFTQDLITVVNGSAGDFAIDTTTLNATDQLLSLCANACFEGATAYSTVPFFTMNTPRDLTLVYTEARAHPRPVVYADVTPTSGTPSQYKFSATLNGNTITWLNGDTQLYFYLA
jgi:hypothetical protein